MDNYISQGDLLMGLWKFRENVSRADLEKVAEQWAEDPKYLQLAIRCVGGKKYGIGFTYQLESQNSRAEQDNYFENFSDSLKRQFGNGLEGWDISNAVRIIK